MALLQGDDGAKSGIVPNVPFGVWGDSGNGGNGVLGTSNNYTAVAGKTSSGSNLAAGVYGEGPTVGVAGFVTHANTAPIGSVGVYGSGSNNRNLGAIGVQGVSDTYFGVWGSGGNAGVVAFNPNNDHAAYLASDCCAAWFTGDVVITGTLSKGHNKFQIDHPLDPANKYLSHSAVESPEMKNVYDGIAVLDANGETVVELPEWFEPLNTDFRYQLTPIGSPGPNLFIAEEISNNRFKIAGGTPTMKVSWQVTGIRQDGWAKAHPMQVEEEKSVEEKGHYLHPELQGAPKEKSIEHVLHPHRTQQVP